MQREMTLMLLARHELDQLLANAQSVQRIARESGDDTQLARAVQLQEDVRNEFKCRAAEADDVPF